MAFSSAGVPPDKARVFGDNDPTLNADTGLSKGVALPGSEAGKEAGLSFGVHSWAWRHGQKLSRKKNCLTRW